MLPYARRRTNKIPSSDFKATCLSSTQLQLETGWTVSKGVTVTLATIVNNTTMGTGKSLNYSHIKNIYINNGSRLHSIAFRLSHMCFYLIWFSSSSRCNLILLRLILFFPWWVYLLYKHIAFLKWVRLLTWIYWTKFYMINLIKLN